MSIKTSKSSYLKLIIGSSTAKMLARNGGLSFKVDYLIPYLGNNALHWLLVGSNFKANRAHAS